MKLLRYFALAGILACQSGTSAADATKSAAASEGPVALHNGSSNIDLLGDGTPAQVFISWRENFNAHGFSAAAIYLKSRTNSADTTRDWVIVPRFGGRYDGETGRELFETSEGADCTLGDLRLIQHRGANAELIIARRELGESFADSAVTHFDYYKLTRNAGELVGWPLWYFAFVRTVDAQRRYCDVNLAFEEELHLGRSGLGHSEASQ